MSKLKKGSITLVGAGPGDPELITVKAVKAIKNADVILYDALVNPILLEYSDSAEKIFVGKRRGAACHIQKEINELMVHYALKGLEVLRLKGGDVSVFSRVHEELEYADLFNIETTLIPGISCFSGIAAKHKVPLTKRGVSEGFWVTTGHTKDGNISRDIKWAARSSATVIILMGMKNLSEIVSEFLKYKSGDYPIAIIQNGTLENERIVLSTLSEIDFDVIKNNIKNPALIVVGAAAKEINSKELMAVEKLYA
jgi:uroporphyrin-III C-methyltransferase